jgi:hypothetical protein
MRDNNSTSFSFSSEATVLLHICKCTESEREGKRKCRSNTRCCDIYARAMYTQNTKTQYGIMRKEITKW